MDSLATVADQLRRVLDAPLFGSPFTLNRILIVLVAIVLLSWATGLITRLLLRLLDRRGYPLGMSSAVHIGRYLVLGLGSLVILQSSGIDLSALTVLLGALGVGLGFGLQGITGNFLSGIIILLERPIKVNDRVDVGGLTGTVRHIGARATTIVTNDEIAIIVPNSEFISGRVTNWSYTGSRIRSRIPVGVAYGSDVEQVRAVLLSVAKAHPGVEQDGKSAVMLVGFGESSLDFELWVWTRSYIQLPTVFRSELNFAIWHALKDAGIQIPFPQRDLHIRSDATGRVSPPS